METMNATDTAGTTGLATEPAAADTDVGNATLIVYHRSDLDGRCAGAIALRKFPGAQLLGMDYGKPFPWDKVDRDTTVVMVDWCIEPVEEMVKLDALCNLIWIDHHRSAMAGVLELGHELAGLQEEGIAACELAWRCFFPDEPVPRTVHLLSLYDVWQHDEDPDAIAFQYGMRMAKFMPESPDWQRIFASDESDIRSTCQDGEAIYLYQMLQYEQTAKACSFETEFDGMKLVAMNAAEKGSLVLESVFDMQRHHAMCTFGWANGHWTVRLYTTHPSVDLSRVCEKHGGGGHAGAGGFQCAELPFVLVPKEPG